LVEEEPRRVEALTVESASTASGGTILTKKRRRAVASTVAVEARKAARLAAPV
jgi:hypothetical protein